MEKKFWHEAGQLWVRGLTEKPNGKDNVVELIALEGDAQAGCVICFWKKRRIDGDGPYIAEIQVVHDRLTSEKFSDEVIMQALRWGQKLADLIVESSPSKL